MVKITKTYSPSLPLPHFCVEWEFKVTIAIGLKQKTEHQDIFSYGSIRQVQAILPSVRSDLSSITKYFSKKKISFFLLKTRDEKKWLENCDLWDAEKEIHELWWRERERERKKYNCTFCDWSKLEREAELGIFRFVLLLSLICFRVCISLLHCSTVWLSLCSFNHN